MKNQPTISTVPGKLAQKLVDFIHDVQSVAVDLEEEASSDGWCDLNDLLFKSGVFARQLLECVTEDAEMHEALRAEVVGLRELVELVDHGFGVPPDLRPTPDEVAEARSQVRASMKAGGFSESVIERALAPTTAIPVRGR